MKKVIILILFLVGMAYGIQYAPPCFEQVNIPRRTFPFPTDPNQIKGYLLGYIATESGRTIGHEFWYCDPDGYPVTLSFSELPRNCKYEKDEQGREWLLWSPDDSQIHKAYYVNITLFDRPPAGCYHRGTIVTIVLYTYPKNRQPVMGMVPGELLSPAAFRFMSRKTFEGIKDESTKTPAALWFKYPTRAELENEFTYVEIQIGNKIRRVKMSELLTFFGFGE